jgi:hypothetical protein
VLQLIVRCAVLTLFVPALMGQTVALTDCTLIDPLHGSATAHSTIIIRGDRIAALGPAASTRIPAGARIVRASGKFVIPGLWDMHVHVGEIEEDWFPLYRANGVTGLREMAASEKNAPRQRQYQPDVAGGRRSGPELFWTLFAMDAPAIQDARQARAEVTRRAGMGLSYIKIYNGLSREAYFAIADECRRRGLQMVGHIPDRVSAWEVERAGQASVEHLDGILLACSRQETQARWMVQDDRYPWKMLLDTFDSAKADTLIESFRAGGVWQTPTLTIHQIASMARDHRLPGDAPVQYARRDYLKAWPREALDGPFGGLDADSARRLITVYRGLVGRMDRRGVHILAGTDALIAIANTRRIHAVVRRGQLIGAAAIRSMLERVQAEVGR